MAGQARRPSARQRGYTHQWDKAAKAWRLSIGTII